MTLVVTWADGNRSIFANMQWEIITSDSVLRMYCGDSYHSVHINDDHFLESNSNMYYVSAKENGWEE